MPGQSKPRRHPALANTPPGEWCPDAVGKVPGYPKTAEAHARRNAMLRATSDRARAARRTVRTGIPNGWGGRRGEIEAHRQEAGDKAKACVAALLRNSIHPEERLLADRADKIAEKPLGELTDDERWTLCATFLIQTTLDPTLTPTTRLKATRVLLEYVVPKPRKMLREVGFEGVLTFLDRLAAKEQDREVEGE